MLVFQPVVYYLILLHWLVCSDTNSVPYSKGNITFILLSSDPVPRPRYNEFYETPELQEFVKAAQIRVKMQDHYYVQQLRHEYFGLYEMIVNAR